MSLETEEVPNCQGCDESIEEGAVVAFGDYLFHVKCFVCNKCGECVESKSNLLLLDNGKPVCDNCSYNCTACGGVIKNEAVMTGNKAYHSDCFKCVSCKKQILDLVFTPTKKGIYCTKCYEARRASKKNKAKPLTLADLPLKDPPTPVRSRSNSSYNTALGQNDSLLSVLSPVTLSFFDSNSCEILDNLSESLGANFSTESTSETQTRINRASEILQSSLRTSSLKQQQESQNEVNNSNSLDIDKLKKELANARSSLKELETDHKALQKASQEALDEFTKVKEEYAKETLIKKQQEHIVTALMRHNYGHLSKKDLEKLAMYRAQLENVCVELIRYRDVLSVEIDQAVDKQTLSNYYSNYQKSLKTQTKNIIQQRDMLQAETKELKQARDSFVHDLISLNNNNNIGPDEIIPPITLSPSHSSSSSVGPRKLSDAGSVISKVSTRNSFLSEQTPTLFRIKKKGSTMFNKLTAPSTKLKPESSLSSSSISNKAPSIYSLSSKLATGSLQNLSSKKPMLNESNLSLHPQHSFQNASFIRPVRCGACNDLMWGRSEYKCEGCGFLSHSKCLSQVPQSCLSNYVARSASSFDLCSDSLSLYAEECKQQNTKGLFGYSLAERVELEGRKIPKIVQECIKAVEERGLTYEGIYRKSGGAAQTRAIQLAFEQGDLTDLCNEDEYNDVCAITSVLKQYLRELPNPLIPFESYQELIDNSTLNNNQTKLDLVSKTISQLPKAHRNTLCSLLQHLSKVCEFSCENKMHIKNMSTVFAPTLMRHQDPSRDFLDISYKNAVVEYLLIHAYELF